MSERMRKILEAGEDNRQADIELGRKLERDRIIAMLRAFVSEDGFGIGETAGIYRAIEFIEGEN